MYLYRDSLFSFLTLLIYIDAGLRFRFYQLSLFCSTLSASLSYVQYVMPFCKEM
jgi:hypothetical protein